LTRNTKKKFFGNSKNVEIKRVKEKEPHREEMKVFFTDKAEDKKKRNESAFRFY
jgi:hypothetical protein